MKALPVTMPAIATTLALKPGISPVQPSAGATAYFNTIMQTEPQTNAPPITSTDAISGPMSLGSKILNGLQNTSAQISNGWQSVSQSVANQAAAPSVATLLQTQTHLMQASIHYELVGKAIAKSTQNIDSIVRMQ